jgi:DNA-binding response OmpR family regulator
LFPKFAAPSTLGVRRFHGARQQAPDTVLLDVRLPGMSRVESLAEIRRIAANSFVFLRQRMAEEVQEPDSVQIPMTWRSG